MALTLTKIAVVDPTQTQRDFVGTPLDATIYTVDLTLGATSDYGATGIDLTSSVLLNAAGIGCTQVIGVIDANVRAAAGTLRNLHYRFDAANKTLRLYRGGNVLFLDTTQVIDTAGATAGPGAAHGFTMPGGTLFANGMGVRFTAWGNAYAVGEVKTITMYYNGTFAAPPATGDTRGSLVTAANAVQQYWTLTTECIRTAATTQTIYTYGSVGTDATATLTNKFITNYWAAGSYTLANPLTIQPTINAASATSASIEGQRAELFNTAGSSSIEVAPTNDLVAGDIVRMTVVCV